MTPYALTMLLFGLLAGAGLATLVTAPSHILGDRLLVAALGALMGLISMILVLGSWHFAAGIFGTAGG